MAQPFGIVGMGVMGASLALNLERNGIPVSVYNYTWDLTEKLLNGAGKGKKIFGARTVYEFVNSLERPRRILLMVTAGKAVDSVIAALTPYLEPGDILIDGGNSLYRDTDRRIRELAPQGISFIGMGVSGGEEGALYGPSLMPGGDEGTYQLLAPILQKIAAKAEDGAPCVTYIGKGSAGHFVKMVHNGIEYGDMQLIAEAYDLLRYGVGLSPKEIAETFAQWNEGELRSFLIEITAKIAAFPDDQGTGGVLVDAILDEAGMKGTGTWTAQAALELLVPIPTIEAAVISRMLSSLKETRTQAQAIFPTGLLSSSVNRAEAVEQIRAALYASKICSYAQGFALLRAASEAYEYGLRFTEIASIWRAGCIIRAVFLGKIRAAFERDPNLPNLLLDPEFAEAIRQRMDGWRNAVALSVRLGTGAPAMSASLAYFDYLRRARLPLNLVQAQRDYFGAHTYKRVDRPGTFHTRWNVS